MSWEFHAPGMWAHRLSPAFPGLVLEAAYSLSPSALLHSELWGLTYGSLWSWGAPGAGKSLGKEQDLSSRWGGHSSTLELGFGRFSFLDLSRDEGRAREVALGVRSLPLGQRSF